MIELGEDMLEKLSRKELAIFAKRELGTVVLAYSDVKVDTSIPVQDRANTIVAFAHEVICKHPALDKLSFREPILILRRPLYDVVYMGQFHMLSDLAIRPRGEFRMDRFDVNTSTEYFGNMSWVMKGITNRLGDISKLEMLKRIEGGIKKF